MAFRKFANASIVKPDIHLDGWAEIRQAGVHGPNFTQREATKVVLQEYNPKDFLLSHCTIIASVDTETSDEPLGKHMVEGFEVNRKYADYLITPETTKYVNNNFDAWEKKLLLACFRTFVGGENYVEHIQIPELSKGKIIDAAARDVGDSIYVDILVATNRKHAPLISAITGGQLQTLSMGCQVEATTCTKCGNVAYDETQLCTHIRYFKGNEYVDGMGKKRKIAELCFPPGTRVLDGAGKPQAIDDLQVGDVVLSHTGNRREVTRTFERHFDGALTTLKVVGLPHTTLRSTPQHPYYVLSPREICTCGCGKKLVTRKTFSRAEYTRTYAAGHNPNTKSSYLAPQSFTFKEAHKIKVGDMLALPIPTAVVVPEDVNEDRATLLGWFLAEGSYHKLRGERVGVEFTLNDADEMSVAEELVRLLSTEFPKNLSERYSEPRIYRTERPEGGHKLVVRYVHRGAAEWFFRHAGEYAGTKQLSEDAIFWPLPIQQKVLRAYVLGDGQSDTLARHSVSSVSDTLITQMQILAARCGFWTCRQVIFDDKSVQLAQVVGGDTSPVDRRGFRPRHELHFQPSDQATNFFDFAKSGEHERHISPAWRTQDGYMLYRVRDVGTEDYSGPVHNISVAEDESYLVEGIATHNCGHISDEPGSVKFIEASWVANPAFAGAVMRNILNPSDVAGLGTRMQVAFSEAPRVAEAGIRQMTARAKSAEFGEQEFPNSQGGGQAAPATPPDPLSKAVDSMADLIRERALEKVRGEIGKQDVKGLPTENLNNNLVKEALQHPAWRRIARVVLGQVKDPKHARTLLLGMVLYKHGGWKAVQASKALRGRDVLALARLFEMSTRTASRAGNGRIYRTVLAVGGISKYPDEATYLAACRRVLGREITNSEKADLLSKGYLYSLGP